MKRIILVLSLCLTLMLACSTTTSAPSAQPDGIETIVHETLQALTANAPAPSETPEAPSAQGLAFQANGISFFIPKELALGADSTLTQGMEYPHINPSFGDEPLHFLATLNSYAAQSELDARIVVFRADEYLAFGTITQEKIDALLAYTDGQPLPEAIHTGFSSQAHAVSFKNGRGLRYLTQVIQGIAPVSNDYLFYYYLGVSADQKYFVEAVLPVHSAYLAENSALDASIPANGIPFDETNFSNYLQSVAEKLNAAESDSFSPRLETLDALIESLQADGF